MTAYLVENLVAGKDITVEGIINAAVMGAIGGFLGGKLMRALDVAMPSLKKGFSFIDDKIKDFVKPKRAEKVAEAEMRCRTVSGQVLLLRD